MDHTRALHAPFRLGAAGEGLDLNFEVVLEMISTFLTERGTRHALIGGLGMAAHGIPRTTVDLDLLVQGEAEEELVRFLETQGYETLYRSTGYSNHHHPDPERGRVDFVYVRGETSQRVFGEARSVMGPHGRPVLVPRPEHIAAMKVLAMKNDPGRTFQEMADIRSLLVLRGVDRGEVRAYFARHGLENRYDEIERTL